MTRILLSGSLPNCDTVDRDPPAQSRLYKKIQRWFLTNVLQKFCKKFLT
jgi:hypothetical protein